MINGGGWGGSTSSNMRALQVLETFVLTQEGLEFKINS